MRTLSLLLTMALPALLVACGGGNKCKTACRKIQTCYGETGGAPACTLSAACSPAELCQAKCINNASCDAITGADLAQQKALQSCIDACTTTKTDTWIILPEGGAPDLGPSDSWMLPDLPQTPDYGPPPDGPAGPPVGKFCNDTMIDGNPYTATLYLGSGASQVTMQAYSGQCSPVVGVACPVIPTGTGLPAEITDGTQPLLSGNLSQEIKMGEEWAFILQWNSSTSQAEFQVGQFKPGYKCQTTDLFTP